MKIAKNKNYTVKVIRMEKETAVNIAINNDKFSLYRYRPINKHTINQFTKDEIYATCPVAFNDPYDAAVRFSERQIKKHIKGSLVKNGKFLKRLLKQNNLHCSQINELVNYIYERDLAPDIQFGNNVYAFACFSTDVNQEIMWAHYAGLATGFVLEYDYSTLRRIGIEHQESIFDIVSELDVIKGYPFNKDIIHDPLLPVIYQNDKYNVTDLCNNYIDAVLEKIDADGGYNPIVFPLEQSLKNYNEKETIRFIQNAYYRKKLPWYYENEWRLIGYNYNPIIGRANDNYVKLGVAKPKAVYLGEKISEYDKDAIIEIARKKGLDVYIMKTVIIGNTLKLKPKKVT